MDGCSHRTSFTRVLKIDKMTLEDGTLECRLLESETVCEECQQIIGYYRFNPNPFWRTLND